MDGKDANFLAREQLQDSLSAERLERITSVYALAPGVVEFHDRQTNEDWLAIFPSAIDTIIPDEQIDDYEQDGDVLCVRSAVEPQWTVINFFVQRFNERHGKRDPLNDQYAWAQNGAEIYPEFFGEVIPPRVTPWGIVVRWRRVKNGIFFLETESAQWVLALSYLTYVVPISDYVQTLGRKCEYDLSLERLGAEFLYYRIQDAAPAFYELLDDDYDDNSELLDWITSMEDLETYLYFHNPQFCMMKNLRKSMGPSNAELKRKAAEAFRLQESDIHPGDFEEEKSFITLHPGADVTLPFILS